MQSLCEICHKFALTAVACISSLLLEALGRGPLRSGVIGRTMKIVIALENRWLFLCSTGNILSWPFKCKN